MYVNAPRLSTPGTLVSTDILQANIIQPSVDVNVGFPSADLAAQSIQRNTPIGPVTYAQSYRADMSSGRNGPGEFMNTDYRCSYKRRSIENNAVVLCENTARPGRFDVEVAPIGLGYIGGSETGWDEYLSEEINPWAGRASVEGIYNSTVIANLQRRGVVECKQKMLESKMDLAESLVDIDKTVLLIVKRVTQVLTAWRSIRKGRFAEGAKHLGITKPRSWSSQSAADIWLELQYGWLPLLSDIHSAFDVVTDALGDPLAHHTYCKRRVSESLLLSQVYGDAGYWESQETTRYAEARVETKFRFRIENSVLAYLSGFKLTNPLYIFWVAMPFSFVVDWILPIGDWLDSLTATLGLQFKDGYQTTKTYGSIVAKAGRKPRHNLYWKVSAQLMQGSTRLEACHLQRSVYTSWPMSLTYFKFPFSSPTRIANAIALTKSVSRLR
ncbi:maturation protein [ssRNA phage SRR7976323_1]|uniref:Maturation protein n=1 Tax=ssRNA phage SRR7976323_1 TaxID=2786688 RepID=A0A8S5L0M2_9VIRU|nr:maturation protein [ssRNA phage SRR7976323_1]DAD51160.1 TPA_asm: maturation protein [ssRNA phage SRR7976323_1]